MLNNSKKVSKYKFRQYLKKKTKYITSKNNVNVRSRNHGKQWKKKICQKKNLVDFFMDL